MKRRTSQPQGRRLAEIAADILEFPMRDPQDGDKTITFETYLEKSYTAAKREWHKTVDDARAFAKGKEFPEEDPDFGPVGKLSAPEGAALRIGLNNDSYERWLNRLRHLGNGRPRRPIDTMFAERTDMMLAELRAPGVLMMKKAEAHLVEAAADRTSIASNPSLAQMSKEMQLAQSAEAYNASQLEKMRPLFEELATGLGTEIGHSKFLVKH